MGDHVPEKVLLEMGKAPRIHADGLARVHAQNGQVTFVLYVDPLALDPTTTCSEQHVECVVTLPLVAVMPAIYMTLIELARVNGQAFLKVGFPGIFH